MQAVLDVPGTKPGIEPGPVPAPKGAVDVPAVVPFKPCSQAAAKVLVARLLDGVHGGLLAEHVRRLEQQAAHPWPGPRRRGMDQRDRAPVAVPDEVGLADARTVEDLGKGDDPLVVHVGERSRKRDGIGGAVSGAAVDERAETRLAGKQRGKIPPRRGAPDSIVQEDERRRIGRPGPMPGKLEAVAACDQGDHRSASSSPGGWYA